MAGEHESVGGHPTADIQAAGDPGAAAGRGLSELSRAESGRDLEMLSSGRWVGQ